MGSPDIIATIAPNITSVTNRPNGFVINIVLYLLLRLRCNRISVTAPLSMGDKLF